MVKEPKEQFRLLKEQIFFWDNAILSAKAMLKHATEARNKNRRALKKLEKRYSE